MNLISPRAIAFVAACIAVSIGFATDSFARAPMSPPNIWLPPRLVIPARTDLPLQLQSVRIRGEVSGRLAYTELEMTFVNPNARILEGELQFPLLDGQSVASFAMDVNGVMREAVPVEKAKGQAVFEEVIRGRIDPGLLEVTQGNNFKLRVYPIPASGTKKVVLRINDTLSEQKGRLLYRVPIEYAETVGMFSLDVGIAASALAKVPAPTTSPNSFGALTFNRTAEGFRAQVVRNDFTGRGVLNVEIAPTNSVQISTQVFDGKTYFHADVPLAFVEVQRVIPKIVGLVWDSSGSGAARDHAREFALLDAYFRKMGNGEVRLTRLRNTAEPVQRFSITNGNWRALRIALAETAYDGATNLGAYLPDSAAREVLLFSDGLSNFGDRAFPTLRVPIYAISAAVKADAGLLRHLAHQNGGRFVDLTVESPASAAHKLTFATSYVADVEGDGAQRLIRTPFPEQGRVSIVGELTEPSTTLRVSIVHPSGRTVRQSIPVSAGKTHSSLAAALWARARIAELEADYDFNRAEIRRLGRAFGMVTRETSLIVLDRIEDYVRYEIVPPTELRADYQRLMASAHLQRSAERKAHLDNIVRLFAEKTAWWNRDFPKDSPLKQEVKIGNAAVGQVREQDAMRRQDRAGEMREMSDMVASVDAAKVVASPRVNAAGNAPAAPAAFGAKRKEDGAQTSATSATTASIQLQKWQPDSPYAARLRSAVASDMYRIYLDEKPGYLNSTAFFLDAADIFFDRGMNELATRILSNLAEMDLENRHILRILGYRLLQAGQPQIAIPVLKKVLALSPEEPQSYRDLGLAYAADKQAQRAIDTLNEVVVRPWQGRFPEVELITLADLNSIIATASEKLDTSRIDPRLLKNLPLDLRVVLTWDADNTDIDLYVTDPDGQKAYYGNRFTYQGGRMSLDFTGGYGPEEFSLKRAKPGKYKVEARYFGDRRQNVTGATTLQAKLTTKFGTPEQQEQIVTLRLKGRAETVFVGEFEVKETR